ncbi:hypothetical protein SCA6_017198 [Theobroma cacao]
MHLMGFSPKCRGWIHHYISTASISVLLNESLSILLHKATNVKIFKRTNIGNSQVSISHLQFVNYILLFGRPQPNQIQNITRILKAFQAISSLRINFSKSMGINVPTNGWCKLDNPSSTNLTLDLQDGRANFSP